MMADHPQIGLGDEGPAVTKAQKLLICRGYPCGPKGADGHFGTNTEAAVRRYQRDRSSGQHLAFSFPLEIDGVIGSETWGRLDPELVKLRTPRQKGDAVKLCQEILKDLAHRLGKHKYDPGKVDSDFGEKTDSAVKAFQGDNRDCDGKKLVVDGDVGEKTWTALRS